VALTRNVTVVVIGGGHSGLAMSKCLSDRGVDHVVLERGEVANSWRTQRWDSLRLLTPNWQSRLPGHAYVGEDPDGFMSMPEVISFVRGYADVVAAPVQTDTTVTAVRAAGDQYLVVTDQGTWTCRSVVLASGPCNLPGVPDFAEAVPRAIDMVSPLDYRNPDQLADGGVLVVGAAATGVQLADEIHRSGRPVTLSVGEHVRMPRTYRGRDIQHWMDVTGRLDERYDQVEEILRARGVASPQLVGTPERSTLDLNALTSIGVSLRGRLGTIRDGVAKFSGGLGNHCALADQKLGRLLDDIDEWVTLKGLDAEVAAPERQARTVIAPHVPLTLDLGSGEIRTIVWATGFKPDLSWLELPVFDDRSRLRHDGGVVDAPGVYLLGSTFLRRRKSSFIHGAGDDAAELSDHLVGFLSGHRAS
jgi:putative flavoprotein involved in K+ transport